MLVWCSLVAGQTEFVCNICGCVNCTIGDLQGVVDFVYNNEQENRPCGLLQQDVETPAIYNTTYCQNVIWREAFEPCLCFNSNGVFLSEIPGECWDMYGGLSINDACISHLRKM